MPGDEEVRTTLRRLASDDSDDLARGEAGLRAAIEVYLPEFLRWPAERQADLAVLHLSVGEALRLVPQANDLAKAASVVVAQLEVHSRVGPPGAMSDPPLDGTVLWLNQMDAVLRALGRILTAIRDEL